jgi:4'-phosphopantetheinyl transferase
MCSAPLKVSISHSGRYVAVVLAYGGKCGVDIEPTEVAPLELPIHERFFSRAEVSWIREAGDHSRRVSRFLRLWTRKESYLKATGQGLAGLSAKIGFDNLSFGASNVWGETGITKYWTRDLGNGEYCLSVCLDRRLEYIEPFTSKIGGLRFSL